MCGFAGFVQLSNPFQDVELAKIAHQMCQRIQHRGPDSEGIWTDAAQGVALGFRRLAILDLSPTGQQPMQSACGRYTLIFNGEIYNYRDLKKEVALSQKFPHPFRGTSDTEVLLACFTVWGIEETLQKTNGMFAIAVWDRELRQITLARDRLGEKPLYYGLQGKTFLFGSELKALKAHPSFENQIDRDVLTLFFRSSYIPSPYSIYQGIQKLPPASMVVFSPATASLSPVKSYWSSLHAAEYGVSHPFQGNEGDALNELEILLKDSVALRMEADVPLGGFLSGGVDSSLIVALMQNLSARPVKTFTMGFAEAAYDESKFAKAVATHLKTDHTEHTVSPQNALEVIPLLPQLYDEPFSDSSQIPTHLVSKIAKQSVTVALAGDGGDELFGGYNRHTWGKTAWQLLEGMPDPLKSAFASGLDLVPPTGWNQLFQTFQPLLPEKLRWNNAGEKLKKLSDILRSNDPEDLYRKLVSHWQEPTALVLGSQEPPSLFTRKEQWPKFQDFSQRMMYLDLVTYLPDDILAKTDRASMGVSLEARVPFLDHRLVEFAWTLPLEMKIKEGRTKHILKQLLYRYVPPELIDRPKMGFSVPTDHWLRNQLKDWAQALLSPDRLRKEGYLNAELVQERWKQHLSGERNFQHHLWDVLMFQAWLESV